MAILGFFRRHHSEQYPDDMVKLQHPQRWSMYNAWANTSMKFKLYPKEMTRPCCHLNLMNSMPMHQNCRHMVAVIEGGVRISHRFIDRSRARFHRRSTIVGGRYVPFLQSDVLFWQSEREHAKTLTSIPEEDQSSCESCLDMLFRISNTNICLGMTKIESKSRRHHRRKGKRRSKNRVVSPETPLEVESRCGTTTMSVAQVHGNLL